MGFLFYAGAKPYKADVEQYSPTEAGGSLSVEAVILSDGGITVEGKKISDRVSELSTGDEIRFPIIDSPGHYYDNVTITLLLPKPVASSTTYELKAVHNVGDTHSYVKDSSTIVFEASSVSETGVLSIIALMPKGTVSPPLTDIVYTFLVGVKSNAWISIGIILPVLTLIFFAFFLVYEMRRQKIDLPDEDTTAPPMALPPAVVGVLNHQKVGAREIAATIIDLALRGNITILDRERDFAFQKNKFDKRLLSYEIVLLSKIFREGMTSDREEVEKRINNHLYSKKMSIVTAGIYVLSTRLGYFRQNPQAVHRKYQIIGIMGTLIGLTGFALSLMIFHTPPFIIFFWIGMIVSTLIVVFMAKKIPIRTLLGQEALSNWLAFRRFLSDKKKMDFSYDNLEVFQKYLPYALVLDCEIAWAKRFSDQNFALPDWFVSTRSGLSLEDFCLSLFPIVSYVSRSLSAIREPGFD